MTRPANLEFAGGSGPLPDAVIQQKLRHAPRWVHVDVDRRREQRGLPPLFAVRAGAAVSRSPAPAAPVKPKVVHTLTILCAPGLSSLTEVGRSKRQLPEVITLAAWRTMLEAIEGGRHIPIQCGHGDAAHVLARSDSPRCRFVLSSAVGLVCQVDLLDADAGRRPDACSIALRTLKYSEERRGGRVIRFIEDAVLDHVAVFERSVMEPVYPLARVVRSTKGYARTAGLDAMTACIGRIQNDTPWLLTR